MSEPRTIPSALASTITIAALTWKRMVRGRALWVSAAIAVLPVMFASAMRSSGHGGAPADLMVFELLMLAVLPPMFVASSIGEEIEERTTVYLWSRAVPRWTVLAGKLVALMPVAIALSVGSWVIALSLGPRVTPTIESCAALAAGVVAISMVSAAIATLVPKHGMPLTISYMLFFDLPVGLMPVSLSELSVTHHVREISAVFPAFNGEVPGELARGAIALAVLSTLWLTVAVLRIRRLEA